MTRSEISIYVWLLGIWPHGSGFEVGRSVFFCYLKDVAEALISLYMCQAELYLVKE